MLLTLLLVAGLRVSSHLLHPQTIIVTGATGKVGRLVVQNLLSRQQSTSHQFQVVALARNATKFHSQFSLNDNLQFVHGDIADPTTLQRVLGRIQPQSEVSVIMVHGTFRPTRFSDLNPFTLFGKKGAVDVSSHIHDKAHPYYVNYLPIIQLIELSKTVKFKKVVRLTGLSTGFLPFNPVSIIFNLLLSFSSKYHSLAEKALMESDLDCVALRPGGLSDEERNVNEANLDVSENSAEIPPPARCSRRDVADLAVEACFFSPPPTPTPTPSSNENRILTLHVRNDPQRGATNAKTFFSAFQPNFPAQKYYRPIIYNSVGFAVATALGAAFGFFLWKILLSRFYLRFLI